MKINLKNIRLRRNDPPTDHSNPILVVEERGSFAPNELNLVFYPDKEVQNGQIVATVTLDKWLPEESKTFLIEILKRVARKSLT